MVPSDPFFAKNHPDLEITGLSSGVGGWIGRRPFLNGDPVFPGSTPDEVRKSRDEVVGRFSSGELKIADIPDPGRLAPTIDSWHMPVDRVIGMCLGVAIGDGLGNTSEGMLPRDRRNRFGIIKNYLPNWNAGGRPLGLPSDDTQLTFRGLKVMLEKGRLCTKDLAQAFSQRPIFGIGRTMRGWLTAYEEAGDGWKARQHSAGNGAVMRVVGLFAPHAWTSGPGGVIGKPRREPTWVWDVIRGSALTHDDPTSTGACVGFSALLDFLLGCKSPPQPDEIVDAYVTASRQIEGEQRLVSKVPGSGYRGPCWRLTAEVSKVIDAEPLQAGEQWYSGAFLLETMPTTIHLIARYRNDPQECLVRAVNDTWDNDTIASMCGAAMGALHGRSAFCAEWLDGLLGRTASDNDGAIGELLSRLEVYAGSGDR
jgi:ADP-ribosyl-[dinitrogen reductase] hydrolase